VYDSNPGGSERTSGQLHADPEDSEEGVESNGQNSDVFDENDTSENCGKC